MKELKTLDQLTVGECSTVKQIASPSDMRRRLRDIGLIEGTTVECVGKSPFGDPSAYFLRGTVIALRTRDARLILVSYLRKEE